MVRWFICFADFALCKQKNWSAKKENEKQVHVFIVHCLLHAGFVYLLSPDKHSADPVIIFHNALLY
jgi:hypothetical protein